MRMDMSVRRLLQMPHHTAIRSQTLNRGGLVVAPYDKGTVQQARHCWAMSHAVASGAVQGEQAKRAEAAARSTWAFMNKAMRRPDGLWCVVVGRVWADRNVPCGRQRLAAPAVYGHIVRRLGCLLVSNALRTSRSSTHAHTHAHAALLCPSLPCYALPSCAVPFPAVLCT
jgi:hypothetical protein